MTKIKYLVFKNKKPSIGDLRKEIDRNSFNIFNTEILEQNLADIDLFEELIEQIAFLQYEENNFKDGYIFVLTGTDIGYLFEVLFEKNIFSHEYLHRTYRPNIIDLKEGAK